MKFINSAIKHISLHFVGNKLNQEKNNYSKKEIYPSPLLEEKLISFFLQPFENIHEKHHFTHANSLKYNEAYCSVKELFTDNESFLDTSVTLAELLYEKSNHPKIKSGEFYLCYFSKYEHEGAYIDAIGIFKTENKSGFFEIDHTADNYSIEYIEGIDIHKLDKACLVLNSKVKDGFEVLIIDKKNSGEEAAYWKEHFLGLKTSITEYHQTNSFLDITKQYVSKQLMEEFEVSKTDQIDLLNRSVDYFKSHDSFDKKEFESEVLQDKGIISSFREFDSRYREDNDLDINDQFDISAPAVKKQAKVFKSVLKLDKNFHIYIHGNKELIEQGIEKDGRKYYKIYFNQET